MACLPNLSQRKAEEEMKTIPLSNSKRVALVSNRDYPLVSQLTWRLMRIARVNYALTTVGKQNVSLHRFIMADTPMVDHWNRNGLDCQRRNMRPCTPSQNQANKIKIKPGHSRFKGVTKDIGEKQPAWIARVMKDGKRIRLGTFPTQRQAAIAYNRGAVKCFGKFARLNKL